MYVWLQEIHSEAGKSIKIAPWVIELLESHGEPAISQMLSELQVAGPVAAIKPASMQNDAAARMVPMVTAPPAGNPGYSQDMQPPYPDVHGMQGFPYAQQQTQQYMAWQFAQQQAVQHPQMQPFDFGGMTQGRAPGMEEERLKFQFPVSVFSIYVLTTGVHPAHVPSPCLVHPIHVSWVSQFRFLSSSRAQTRMLLAQLDTHLYNNVYHHRLQGIHACFWESYEKGTD
jgi:hypothetical protein